MITENLAGVIFALCVIWLFVIKWLLAPGKERFPLALQVAALICLCWTWIFMVRWYENRPLRYPSDWIIHVLYFYIPLPIGVLGCRVVWYFFSIRNEKSWLTQFCWQICIFLTLAVLFSVFSALITPLQKVREAALFAGTAFFH
jgi:hypothetical protein